MSTRHARGAHFLHHWLFHHRLQACHLPCAEREQDVFNVDATVMVVRLETLVAMTAYKSRRTIFEQSNDYYLRTNLTAITYAPTT